MQFTVRDWMIDLVVFVDPEGTVDEALALMRRRYIHSLIVNKTADSPEYGIVTSTDICDKIIAQECIPANTKIKEIILRGGESNSLKEYLPPAVENDHLFQARSAPHPGQFQCDAI